MRFQILFYLFFSTALLAQDSYHQSLLDNFSMNYGLEGGVFIFADTEEELSNIGYQYGNMVVTNETIDNQDFSRSKNILVNTAGTNAWDAGMGVGTTVSVSQDDLILITFWGKLNSSSSQVYVFAEESVSFEKEFYFPLEFTPDWTQYFIAFNATRNFNIDRLKAGFHLATMPQDIDIAGFTALNYEDNYEISDLPSSFSPFNYEGSDPNHPWRQLAEDRIENLRKSDLMIRVVDANGTAVSDANVEIEMQQHDFGFGSALVTCRFPGNNCYDQTYVDKVLDLDGEGHGFNECVNENALKWRAWEQEWLGTPEETVSAFEWLTENGITMRGHNIIWPGSDYLPQDVLNNLNDIDYLRQRIHDRIEEMVNHPRLSQVVRDWDVLNEITTNRTLEESFNNDPNFENGRKLYNEIFSKVRELDPELELYINDYMAISSGSANLIARYKSFLDELKNDNVPFDGIGFQCHIGSVPNSIPMVKETFDDFYERYGKRMKVTEYDINPAVDETIQANYMRDLLTLTFSHPGMDAFVMWGFWDGNHWKDNAPMFDIDWQLKPSGEAFIQKVFNDWWTEETSVSDQNGVAVFRPFKGTHKITVSKDGAIVEAEISLDSDEDVTLTLDLLDSVNELDSTQFKLSPNPTTDGSMTIEFSEQYKTVDLVLFNLSGKKVKNLERVTSGSKLLFDVVPGTYQLKIVNGKGFTFHKIIIL